MKDKQKIYLSGGFGTGWQQKITSNISKEFILYNPREHGLLKSEQYSIWDLHFVRKCDILFCYMEDSNPSGIGMAVEIGYAKALSKTIILVDEKSEYDTEFKKRFDIVRESADIIFNDISKAIKYLKYFK